MKISLVPPRSYDPEILDRQDNTCEDLQEAFRDISFINRRLGGIATLWRPLRAVLTRRGLREFTLLDVGTGGGDVPRGILERAAGVGITARAAGLDFDREIVRYAHTQSQWGEAHSVRRLVMEKVHFLVANKGPAGHVSGDVTDPRPSRGTERSRASASPPTQGRYGGPPAPIAEPLAVVRGDAFRLPFADASFDFVTSSMMAHHFRERDVSRLLAEMARVARQAVLLNDLARNLVPWLAIRAFGLFLRSPMVRHDGPLSVLRGWTAPELLVVAREAGLGDRARVERRFPYRLVLIVTRDVPAPTASLDVPRTGTSHEAPLGPGPRSDESSSVMIKTHDGLVEMLALRRSHGAPAYLRHDPRSCPIERAAHFLRVAMEHIGLRSVPWAGLIRRAGAAAIVRSVIQRHGLTAPRPARSGFLP